MRFSNELAGELRRYSHHRHLFLMCSDLFLISHACASESMIVPSASRFCFYLFRPWHHIERVFITD